MSERFINTGVYEAFYYGTCSRDGWALRSALPTALSPLRITVNF